MLLIDDVGSLVVESIVVPAQRPVGDVGVGHRFGKLVRGGLGHALDDREPGDLLVADRAAGIGDRHIANVGGAAAGIVTGEAAVVAQEAKQAGAVVVDADGHVILDEDDVEPVRVGRLDQSGADRQLQIDLDRRIGQHGGLVDQERVVRGGAGGAPADAVTRGGEHIHEGTVDDHVDEAVEVGRLLHIGWIADPIRAQEDGLRLDVRQQRAAVVGERRGVAWLKRFELEPDRAAPAGRTCRLPSKQLPRPTNHRELLRAWMTRCASQDAASSSAEDRTERGLHAASAGRTPETPVQVKSVLLGASALAPHTGGAW